MARNSKNWEAFGLVWTPDVTMLDVHIYMIHQGKEWLEQQGRSLFYHYREMQSLLWPGYDHHEWSDLMLKTILENRITAVLGPKDGGKTHIMARFALTDYFCFPRDTLILMSSTDIRGLELRVFGEVKSLYESAKEVWPDAPGNSVDSMHAIFTDSIDEDSEVRDTRRGLICIPVLDSSGQWKGLSKWVGIKQKRRRVLADETQFYASPYLSSLANLDKGDFKGVFVGNPIGEGDPLDKLAEPADGWDNLPEISKTTTWKNRMGGVTINFVGTDSPAIKHPGKYTYLINQADIDRIVDYWGKESAEYWNQAAGVRRPGISVRRVVTRDMVTQFKAQEPVVWKGNNTTKVYAIDSGYGGDRCVGGDAEFGTDINGHEVLCLSRPRIIPIRIYPKNTPEADRVLPEDQIAEYVKADCERLGIAAANVFHDSTGRGSLGTAFARLWRHDCNPVEFGGAPTLRPVQSDLFIYDEKLRQKRLKRCDEHYSKRVSELHFSVRYVIEGRQMRGLTNEVCDELCAREWKRIKGDRIEVESKDETKERVGRSPDLGDWCFSGDTLVATPEGQRRIDTLAVGDKVLTPYGEAAIAQLRLSHVSALTTVKFSNGASLTGRGEHKALTLNRGWVSMDCLTITDEVETLANRPIWQFLDALFTRAESTGFKQAVDIIRTVTNGHRSDFYTELSGRSTSGKFLSGIASITKMAIGKITDHPTWSLCGLARTWRTILKSVGKTRAIAREVCETFEALTAKRRFGIVPEPVTSGIPRTASGNGNSTVSKVARSALSASVVSGPIHPSCEVSTSARPGVKASGPMKKRVTFSALARSAITSLWLISTGKRSTVRVTVQRSQLRESRPVYNLTLDADNVYYANGILVQNCAIIVEGARRLGFQIARLANATPQENDDPWRERVRARQEQLQKSYALQYSA